MPLALLTQDHLNAFDRFMAENGGSQEVLK